MLDTASERDVITTVDVCVWCDPVHLPPTLPEQTYRSRICDACAERLARTAARKLAERREAEWERDDG